MAKVFADSSINEGYKNAEGQGYHGAQKGGAGDVVGKFFPDLMVQEGAIGLDTGGNGEGNQVDEQHEQNVESHFIQDFLSEAFGFEPFAHPKYFYRTHQNANQKYSQGSEEQNAPCYGDVGFRALVLVACGHGFYEQDKPAQDQPNDAKGQNAL